MIFYIVPSASVLIETILNQPFLSTDTSIESLKKCHRIDAQFLTHTLDIY